MNNESKKNVLLITSDQWRGDCVSAFGHSCIKTPNYDKLIADGVAFRNHFSVCAPCGPARASLLTGMYMQNHRSVRNGTPLDDRHTNIAREVRKVGYSPVLFGYTDTSLDPRTYSHADVTKHGYENLMPGFDEGLLLPAEEPQAWLEYLNSQGHHFSSVDDAFALQTHYPQSENRGYTYSPPRFAAEQSQTAFLTQQTIDYLDSTSENWFVHLSYLRPHPPFIAPEPYNKMYDPDTVPMPQRMEAPSKQAEKHPWLASALGANGDWFDPWMREALKTSTYDHELRQIRATYYGLVSKVDHYIGKLIAYLQRSGQYENTLIILTSDHGELLGDQWLFGKRGYFDSGYKIPLIMRLPEQAKNTRGKHIYQFTESVDIMPTILEWLEIDKPRQCDGASLLPFAHNHTPSKWRSEVHWEYDFRDNRHQGLEQELGISTDECQLNVIRNQQHKYVHFTALPPLFFDLASDPNECNNLVDDPAFATSVLSLSRKMLSWRMLNDERTLTGLEVSRKDIFSRY